MRKSIAESLCAELVKRDIRYRFVRSGRTLTCYVHMFGDRTAETADWVQVFDGDDLIYLVESTEAVGGRFTHLR